jgi:hypothetical protein
MSEWQALGWRILQRAGISHGFRKGAGAICPEWQRPLLEMDEESEIPECEIEIDDLAWDSSLRQAFTLASLESKVREHGGDFSGELA